MSGLLADAKKSPLSHIIIITLFGVGLCSLPLNKLLRLFIADTLTADLIGGTAVRIIFGAVGLFFIGKYGFFGNLFSRPTFKGLLFSIPALIVVVNNFPIIGVIQGNVIVTDGGLNFILYLFYCLSVGFYEEIFFRGLVFPVCLIKTKDNKYSTFWAIAISSAVFGVAHLLNLFGGASFGGTMLQIGYSFLIGGMCAISLCLTNNLIVPILLHFIYDIGGLFTSEIGVAIGNQWDTVTVIITAVLGVIVLIYMLYVVFVKNPKPKVLESLSTDK